MIKFSQKVLHFVARKLTIISEGIKQRQKKEAEIAAEVTWLARFNADGYFDHSLNNGFKIRLYNDSILSKYIVNGFEDNELKFLRRFLKSGDNFLDIGANIGLFSLEASAVIGKQGQIIAFEPSPKTFARLQENISINNIENVMTVNIGLSNKEDVLQLNVSEDGHDAWNSFANMNDGKTQITTQAKVRKLDDVLKETGTEKVVLVKLDVEGWEKYVLYGGEVFFKAQSPVVMVEFTEDNTFAAGYQVQELFDIMEEWGYKWYRYNDGVLLPETKQLHYPYDNLFAIKNLDYVNIRLNQSI